MLFQGANILGSPPTKLPLATRKGNRIANEVIPDPDDAERHQADLFIKLFGKQWERRKPHLGVYNCAGHVWASRRTAILDEETIRLILTDDRYRRLRNDEQPLPGDLVLYWHAPLAGKPMWLHVGMVCAIRILENCAFPGFSANGEPPPASGCTASTMFPMTSKALRRRSNSGPIARKRYGDG